MLFAFFFPIFQSDKLRDWQIVKLLPTPPKISIERTIISDQLLYSLWSLLFMRISPNHMDLSLCLTYLRTASHSQSQPEQSALSLSIFVCFHFLFGHEWISFQGILGFHETRVRSTTNCNFLCKRENSPITGLVSINWSQLSLAIAHVTVQAMNTLGKSFIVNLIVNFCMVQLSLQ